MDLQTDAAHCGDCANACSAIETCVAGTCEVSCIPPATPCGSGSAAVCTDLGTDASHCGNCAVACDPGETCRFGFCTTAGCRGLLLPGPPLSPTGAAPVTLAAADFTGDAITDVVVADASGSLLLLVGRGDGTFDPPREIPLPASLSETLRAVSAIVTADFDGDSRPDLLLATGAVGVAALQPILGDGAGGFVALPGSALDAGAGPGALALVDLNLDGRPDLVVGDGTGQTVDNLRVFLNDGTGLFGLPSGTDAPRAPDETFTTGVDVRGVAGADVNGDLLPDVVVVWDGGAQGGEILLGTGGGALVRPTFNGVPTHQFALAEPGPSALATGDLNNDTYDDWVVVHASTNAITVQLASTDGGRPGTVSTLYGVAEPRGVVIAEFDGDLYPELLTVDAAAGALLYHHNAGPVAGGVTFDAPLPLPVGTRPMATVLAPVADAGPVYLFTLDGESRDVAATRPLGGGTFGSPIRFPGGPATSAVALGDFDGVAGPDLAMADTSVDRIDIWLQILAAAPDGSFGTRAPSQYLPSGSAPSSLVTADLDGDSRMDLALALSGIAQVAVLWGDGAGSFSAPQRLNVGADPRQVIAEDLDGDGRLDLATANAASSSVTVLHGVPGPSFSPRTYDVGAAPVAIAALTLGPGTCKDLVTANPADGTISILACSPTGFSAAVKVGACAGARSLATGDFDGNGVQDLAVACDAGIAILHAPGDGTLAGGALFDAGGAVRSVTAADVDGDGRPDLIAAVPGTGSASVLLGAGAMAFSPPQRFPIGGDPLAATAADVDGDGRTDVCMTVGTPATAFYGGGAVLLRSGCLP